MDSLDPSLVTGLSSVVKPIVNSLIETWVNPKLTKLLQNRDRNLAIENHSLTEQFAEYVERIYSKHLFLTTIIFQRELVDLKSLYIPLTVFTHNKRHNEVSFVIREFADEFVPTLKRVLITDSAGMGKSTLMKFLLLSCIEANKGVPIFVELRKLSREHSLLNFIVNELSPVNESIDRQLVLDLIKRGDFIFFFDGYDEIPPEDREVVTTALHDFISKASSNKFIMTSRPETALASFTSFKPFQIRPLSMDEAFALLRKYDMRGEIAEGLIVKLQEPEARNIHEFLSNPLLVSLLYQSYEHTPVIPNKKISFYRQVFDSLYHRHDLSKDGSFVRRKNSQLNIDDFHTVLRNIGFITAKSGRVEYEKDELLRIINEAKNNSPNLSFKASDFFEDLLRTVPLFAADGDLYRWAHKSIQEYFAAQFICIDTKEKQKSILKVMASYEKIQTYINILDLCYDIDYRTFRQAILYELARDYVAYYEGSYTDDYDGVKERDLEVRKFLAFDMQAVFLPQADYVNLLESENSDNNSDASGNKKLNIRRERIDFRKLERKLVNLPGLKFSRSRLHMMLGGLTGSERTRTSFQKNIVVLFEGNYGRLNRLLAVKNDALVYRRMPKFLSDWHKTLPQSRTELQQTSFALNAPTVMDDDPSSILNTNENFNKTNFHLVSLTHRQRPYKLSQCKKLIEEVESELQLDTSNDLLSGI